MDKKNNGIGLSHFSEAMERASSDKDGCGVRRVPGTDIMDPYGLSIKPKGVPAWETVPVTPAEEAVYFGVHIHTESNPLGLHTHVMGGTLSGGHSHGPSNRYGCHSHRQGKVLYGYSVDGEHVHDGENCPAGKHIHVPEHFG